MLKIGDYFVFSIIAILTVSVFVFTARDRLNSNGNLFAEIIVDGTVVEKVNLEAIQKREEISVKHRPNVVLAIENSKIRFKKSDCPDKICIRNGWLSQKGDYSICMPERTMIKIISGVINKNPEVDIVAH